MRTCSRCKLDLTPADFYPRRERGGLSSKCKACHSELSRAYYALNKNRLDARSKLHGASIAGRWSQLAHRAERAGIEVTLTREQMAKLLSGASCHYCDAPLSKFGVGLDRKDSDGHYSFENCVPCCRVCNVAKNDWFSYEEFLTHLAPAIRAVWAARASAGKGAA